MTAKCQLCGAVVRAETAGMILNPGSDPAAAAAIAEISLFDLLAGRMSQHMERHAEQNAEMIAVMHLAGKVYAMTFAESPEEPEYSKLREAWRTGILQMMASTTMPIAIYDDAAEGNSSAPSGTKEKKSVRNASN